MDSEPRAGVQFYLHSPGRGHGRNKKHACPSRHGQVRQLAHPGACHWSSVVATSDCGGCA